MQLLRSHPSTRVAVILLGLALTLLSSLPTLGSTWNTSDRPLPSTPAPISFSDGSPVTVKVHTTRASTDIRLRPMAVGSGHACAILADDRVICWGKNDWGQLGTVGPASISFPVFVHRLAAPPVNLAAGEEHTCALLADGRVQCWGGNASGQLGNGSFSWTPHPAPSFVTGLEDKAIDLAAGSWHTCALLRNGHIQCWGANVTGQLGNGTVTTQAKPVTVHLPGPATWVTAGCNHTCALLADGRMYCWGWNVRGQLGVTGTLQSTTPVQVTAVSGRGVTIEAGCNHTCAAYRNARGERELSCWGGTGLYQMPAQQGARVSLLLMRAGMGHTCILTAQHGLLCWGYNSYGQLGDGTRHSRHTLAPVIGMTRDVFYMTTSASANHTCAVLNNGGAFCWGSNMWGQLGNGSLTLAPVPHRVLNLKHVRAVDAGEDFTCAVRANGSLWCWGKRFNTSFYGDTSIPTHLPTPAQGIANVSTGESHSCLLMGNKSLRCWGDNEYGQLGDGTTQLSTTPVPVRALGGKARSVQVGKDFTCALLTNGSVRCWGHNNHGQLGIGSKEDQHRPVTVQRLSHIKDIGLGAQHACAVAEDGSVYCWGANGFGQIGDGSLRERLSPVRINLPGPATHVTGGVYHTCARLQNGQVWCWGSNSQGELGNPSADVWSKVPVRVQGLNGPASDVDAGGLTTCAVVRGGVRCWGFNMYGQVGDGTYRSRATPVPVVGVNAGAKRVHVAFDHVCVRMDAAHGDRVLCWGSDAYGQLGRRRDLRWTRPIPLGETPPPYVQSDHTTGRVGSVFTLVGANFPTSTHGRVIINGRTVLTSLPVGESGQVRFFVNSQGADPGDYVVVVQVGSKRAAVVLRLTRTGVKYPGEGGGITVRVPSHSARHFHRQHMPHVVR